MLSKFTNIFLTLKYIKANYDFQDCWILSLYYSIKFYCYWLHINKRLVRKTYIYHKLPFCFYGHYNIQTIKRLFISLHDPSNFILLHPSKFQILNKASSIGFKIKKTRFLPTRDLVTTFSFPRTSRYSSPFFSSRHFVVLSDQCVSSSSKTPRLRRVHRPTRLQHRIDGEKRIRCQEGEVRF